MKKLKLGLQHKQFSLEEISKFFIGEDNKVSLFDDFLDYRINNKTKITFKDWFIQTKQSLSTQQLPVSFEPEYVNTNSFRSETNGYDSGNFVLKTTINSECKYELVGTYKY